VKCFLEVFWGGGFRTENGDFSFLWDYVKFFFSRKIFLAKYFSKFFQENPVGNFPGRFDIFFSRGLPEFFRQSPMKIFS